MKKGSITIYLSLALCVMVSLIFVSLDSARYSCGRAMVSLSAEEGLFSLFGEYDRLIYDNYGLLTIDGGYGSASLNAGALMDEVTDVFEKIVAPDDLLGLPSSNLFRVDVDSKAVTGLVLATDSGCQMLKDQIIEIMKVRAGADAISALIGIDSDAADILSEAENSGTDMDKMDELKAEYENQKQTAIAAAEEAKNAAGESSSGSEIAKAEVPADFVDPTDNITALKNMGIMATVIPKGTGISVESIDLSSLASKRNFAEGIGDLPEESSSAADAFYLAQYIIDYFPNFLSEDTGSGLKYQAEFAIAGKSTDSENLKSVLTRLLLIREALNYLYIMTDSAMKAEADAAAAAICTLFAMPAATQVASQILILCWAYGESMQDLKILLSGGKVPVFKDKSSWKLSLSNLASLSADSTADGNSTGLTYENYLCVLLMMEGSDAIMTDITDLLEYNRRILGNEPEFSIDTCVCAMEIQLEGCIDRHKFTLNRSYGYDICT